MTTVRDLLNRRIVAMLGDPGSKGYIWETDNARYRDVSTGRFVSEATIETRIESYNDTVIADRVTQHTQGLVDGTTSLPDWQRAVAKELKDAYVVNLQVGRGGRKATTQSDYGRIGGRLAFEYGKLNGFAFEIANRQYDIDGKLILGPSDAQILARAKLYARGPRTAYFDGQTAGKEAAEYTEERRILNPAEHCEDCVAYEALGWQPIGTLPPPGVGSRCQHNCRCEKKYRTADERE